MSTDLVHVDTFAIVPQAAELADLIRRHPDLGIEPALITPGQDLILIYCPSAEAVA